MHSVTAYIMPTTAKGPMVVQKVLGWHHAKGLMMVARTLWSYQGLVLSLGRGNHHSTKGTFMVPLDLHWLHGTKYLIECEGARRQSICKEPYEGAISHIIVKESCDGARVLGANIGTLVAAQYTWDHHS